MNDAVVKLCCRSVCQIVMSPLIFTFGSRDSIEGRRSYSDRNAGKHYGDDQRDMHLRPPAG